MVFAPLMYPVTEVAAKAADDVATTTSSNADQSGLSLATEPMPLLFAPLFPTFNFDPSAAAVPVPANAKPDNSRGNTAEKPCSSSCGGDHHHGHVKDEPKRPKEGAKAAVVVAKVDGAHDAKKSKKSKKHGSRGCCQGGNCNIM